MIVLERKRGLEALEWLRENPWVGHGLQVLVPTHLYTGRTGAEWCDVTAVSPGTASVYPIKAQIRDAGVGQWKYDEVQRVRMDERALIGLMEHVRHGVVFPWLDADLLRSL